MLSISNAVALPGKSKQSLYSGELNLIYAYSFKILQKACISSVLPSAFI